jgi:hypothetical protein
MRISKVGKIIEYVKTHTHVRIHTHKHTTHTYIYIYYVSAVRVFLVIFQFKVNEVMARMFNKLNTYIS